MSLESILNTVKELVSCDEIETALYLLDHLPAKYRENYPIEAEKLKAKIYRRIHSINDYLDGQDSIDTDGEMFDSQFCWPRAGIIKQLVDDLNSKGKIPHIVEMGPGSFWLPFGLKKKACKFTYYTEISHDLELFDLIFFQLDNYWQRFPKDNNPTIFCALEIIEHLWNPKDIVHHACKLKYDGKPHDYVMISTPWGALSGGVGDNENPIGHIRTYTKAELVRWCEDNFPGYVWRMAAQDHALVMLGQHRDYHE